MWRPNIYMLLCPHAKWLMLKAHETCLRSKYQLKLIIATSEKMFQTIKIHLEKNEFKVSKS